MRTDPSFASPILLGVGPGSDVRCAGAQTVANIIFGRYSGGNFPIAAAMMVALVTVNMIAVLIGRKWITRAIGEH